MKDQDQPNTHVLEEQLAYASVLDVLIKIGFAGLLITFLIYVSRAMVPYIPMEDLADLWHLPLDEFLARTGAPSRPWQWTSFLGYGDIINYVPVVFIGSISFVCLARVLPVFIKKRDGAYIAIVIIQLFVIALAASGILAASAH
jgi:hypothetical protein